jgi:hypothetical protein
VPPATVPPATVPQTIVAFHEDALGDWVAELACGHMQHVRHNPPLVSRPWVLTAAGRESFLGHELPCKQCVESGAERAD